MTTPVLLKEKEQLLQTLQTEQEARRNRSGIRTYQETVTRTGRSIYDFTE